MGLVCQGCPVYNDVCLSTDVRFITELLPSAMCVVKFLGKKKPHDNTHSRRVQIALTGKLQFKFSHDGTALVGALILVGLKKQAWINMKPLTKLLNM